MRRRPGMTLLGRVHAKLGDLWWYTVLLFVAQRFGDAVNMVIGIWLVPKYVPMQELGAVLPLLSIVGIVGLPFAVVTTPLTRFLAVYSKNGELGKAKAMFRDAFVASAALLLVSFLIAAFALPFFFERLWIGKGSLGVLVVAVALLGTLSSIVGSAVQGLGKFDAAVAINAISAPFRLVTFVVLLPFRPLSAYFVGQAAQPGVTIVGGLWACRSLLRRTVRAVPYLREDGRKILCYTLPVLLWTVATTVAGNVDMMLVRHRLPAFDSAGYYVISRFSEVAAYFGSAFAFLLFPMASTCGSKDAKSLRLIRHAMFGCAASGALVAGLLAVGGEWLLSLTSVWRPYVGFSDEMALLALNGAVGIAVTCLVSFEMAQDRFGFLWYLVPLFAIKALLLLSISGCVFFGDLVPAGLRAAIDSINPNRLSFLVMAFLVFNVICAVLLAVDVFTVRSGQKPSEGE